MENKYIWVIAAVCLAAVLIWMFRCHKKWIVNFLLRACSGILAVYALNLFLAWRGISLAVGINPITAGVVGVLGVPGIVALYGIVLYFK